MIHHDGCLDDLSAGTDMCPFVVCHMPHVEILIITGVSLKLIAIQVANMCCGIKGLLLIHCVPQCKNSYYALVRSYVLQRAICPHHIPWILALGANDVVIGAPFDRGGCLQ